MLQIKELSARIVSHFYKNRSILLPTLAYSFLIIYLSYFHAVWRDEARALSIVIESKSIIQLFQHLHNEGHPFLWYLFLWIGFKLIHSVVVLKIASVLVAIGAVYFFLLKSPFSLIQKVLFIFGFFPAYQYSVICRGYGLSMALLFLVSFLYPKRFSQSILFGALLFLLANSEANALIITIAILLSWMAEFIWKRKYAESGASYQIAGFMITAGGILFSIWQAFPDQTTVITNIGSLSLGAVSREFFNTVLFAGNSFEKGLGIPWVPGFIIVWLFYAYLIRRIFLLTICFMSITGMAIFGHLVYLLKLWHQGYLYLIIITAFWMEIIGSSYNKEPPSSTNRGIFFLSKSKHVFLYVLLIAQLVMGYHAISRELRIPYSSSKNFGDYLNRHLELKNAIILGEPDYFMESVSYYSPNDIYIPREGRFGRITSFTKVNKSSYSLGEILGAAQKLEYQYHRPVLIAMTATFNPDGPYIWHCYQKDIPYSRKQLARFLESTSKVAAFRNETITDEKYDVFLVK